MRVIITVLLLIVAYSNCMAENKIGKDRHGNKQSVSVSNTYGGRVAIKKEVEYDPESESNVTVNYPVRDIDLRDPTLERVIFDGKEYIIYRRN